MKANKKIAVKTKPKWKVLVEYTGTTVQREQALKQATRFVLLRLAEKKKPPKEETCKSSDKTV